MISSIVATNVVWHWLQPATLLYFQKKSNNYRSLHLCFTFLKENKRFLTKIFRIIKIKYFKTVHEMWRFQKLASQYFEILVLCLTQFPLRSYWLHEISVNYESWHSWIASSPIRSSHPEDISKGGTIESNNVLSWFSNVAFDLKLCSHCNGIFLKIYFDKVWI